MGRWMGRGFTGPSPPPPPAVREAQVLENRSRGAELCSPSRGQNRQAGPRNICLALHRAEGVGGLGGIPRGGSRAQAMSASSSPVPPWHQPGWHWVQRAWESRVEEALVPSKILPARGCDAWAEGGKGCEEIQGAPSKKAPSQRCSPPAKVFSRSAPCSREVSVWDHTRAALALAPLKAAAAGGTPGVASLSYCRPPHFT